MKARRVMVMHGMHEPSSARRLLVMHGMGATEPVNHDGEYIVNAFMDESEGTTLIGEGLTALLEALRTAANAYYPGLGDAFKKIGGALVKPLGETEDTYRRTLAYVVKYLPAESAEKTLAAMKGQKFGSDLFNALLADHLALDSDDWMAERAMLTLFGLNVSVQRRFADKMLKVMAAAGAPPWASAAVTLKIASELHEWELARQMHAIVQGVGTPGGAKSYNINEPHDVSWAAAATRAWNQGTLKAVRGKGGGTGLLIVGGVVAFLLFRK